MQHIKKHWYSISLFILCLTPIFWFLGHGSAIVNGLDTNFPLDPITWFIRRFYIWNNILNSGQDFNTSVAGMLFHFIQVIPYVLGLKLQFVEIFSMVFWFSAIVLSAHFFIASIVEKSKVARFIFVLLYAFNPYLYNTWENVKVANLALMVGIPLYLGILVRFKNKQFSFLKLFVLTVFSSVLVVGSGINPAYFIALVITTIVLFLIQLLDFNKREEFFRTIKGYSLFLAGIILVNLFWIIPLVNFLFLSRSVSSLSDLGFTNWLDSLSVNTSIVNVIRFQGAWDWYVRDTNGTPLYIPYASNYFYNLAFIIFSFSSFILSLISLIFVQKNKKVFYVFLSVLALLGIFLASGTHEPTGYLYRLLVNKLPFFSFFRSPWYIFTPFIMISLSGLIALFIEKLELEVSGKIKRSFYICVSIFVICHLLYSYPLVTGKIFRPDRKDGFYTNFPGYVLETKTWLDTNSNINRIVSYPDDTLESFEWGYKGTESILGLMTTKEIFIPSFNDNNIATSDMLRHFYSYIKKEEYSSAVGILKLLGVDTIFDKRDSSSLSPRITEKLNKSVDSHKIIGAWDFYELAENQTNKKIFSPKVVYENLSNTDGLAAVAPLTLVDSVVVGTHDSEIAKSPKVSEISREIIEAKNITDEPGELVLRQQKYIVEVRTPGNYELALERSGFDISNIRLEIDDLNVRAGEVKESFLTWNVYFNNSGKHEIIITYPETEDLISDVDFSKYTDETDPYLGILPTDPKTILNAYNPDGNDELRIKIPNAGFNPFYQYAFSFDYRFFYGDTPIVQILQSTVSSPLRLNSINVRSSSDWDNHIGLIEPLAIKDSNLDIEVILPANDKSERSKSFLKSFSLKKLNNNRVFLIKKNDLVFVDPDIEFTMISPVHYRVNVKNIKGDYILAFLENYSEGWELKSTNQKDNPVSHFSINGYANAWYLPSNGPEQEYEIYYAPQNLFIVGLVISALVVFGSLGLVIFNKYIQHFSKRDYKNE